jgi:Tol biopolymer transport system component
MYLRMLGAHKTSLPHKRFSLNIIMITIVLLAMVLFKNSHAQYFGQNKMQYQDFNFKILESRHFDIYYYPDEEKAAKIAARMAERWYARYLKMFGFGLSSRQPIILYSSNPQFQQTNVVYEDISEGVGGFTEPLKRRIVLPLAGPLAETDHVIGHELVHAFQYDSTGHRGGEREFLNPNIESLPLWFVEGMAEYLSLGYNDPNTAMWMRDAVANQKDFPKIRDLTDPEYFPYRYGQALLAYIAGRWGDDKIIRLLIDSGRRGNLEDAIRKELGVSTDTLSMQWHNDLLSAYSGFSNVYKKASDYGKLLISKKTGSGQYNVGPVISPNGKNLVFFSEKDLFAIDLYLADAYSGKINKNILRTEFDPHFQSLQFINSAGTWSPDGEQVAFAIISEGRPALSFLNISEDKVVREIPFPGIGEIIDPAWSPDGRYMLFSAKVGGLSDLYLYDLENSWLQRITDDEYADIQPAWSPDGKRFVFVTDRYTTDLSDLKTGDYRLAIYDLGTGTMQPLNCFDKGKNINPQWSADGNSIYFISDQNGIDNLYRRDLNTDMIYQLTDLYTGVSGITGLSPAMSVSTRSDRLIYSVFENNGYSIYAIDSLSTKQGLVVSPNVAAIPPYTLVGQVLVQKNPGILPPARRLDTDSTWTSIRNNQTLGLSYADSLQYRDYRTKYSLDYIDQPYLSLGIDQYGVQFGTGIGLYWSDMLGNHNLVTSAQVNYDAGLTDLSALAGYLNTAHRLNWGAVLQQTPYTYIQYGSSLALLPDTTLAEVDQELWLQQLNRSLAGILRYPFSRTKRLELSAGISRISFDYRLRTWLYNYDDGSLISKTTDKLPSPAPLNLVDLSTAYVYDNSIYGATSPIAGHRFRLEFAPTFGNLSMYSITADYRYYFLPIRPITLAGRLLHYGRYGGGAEDPRLLPLYVGDPTLVRGYDLYSFDNSEYGLYESMLGSKIAVLNAEMRFPLLGLFSLGRGYYGYLPLETGIFYDSGVAWSNGSSPTFLGGHRTPVSSYGAVARFNLFGFAVVEADYVKPLERPSKGWLWEFNFNAGF